jgi:hypothetical protein
VVRVAVLANVEVIARTDAGVAAVSDAERCGAAANALVVVAVTVSAVVIASSVAVRCGAIAVAAVWVAAGASSPPAALRSGALSLPRPSS